MHRQTRAAALLLACAACEVDLRVGAVPPEDAFVRDASVRDGGASDAGFLDAGFVDAGLRDGGAPPALDWRVNPTPEIMCTDGLAGQEPLFTGVRPADFGVSGGPIDIELDPSWVALNGPPILLAFGVERLVLRPDVVPEQPAGTFLGGVNRDGPGPNGTRVSAVLVYVDRTQTNLAGFVGVELIDPQGDGACFASFAHAIVEP